MNDATVRMAEPGASPPMPPTITQARLAFRMPYSSEFTTRAMLPCSILSSLSIGTRCESQGRR